MFQLNVPFCVCCEFFDQQIQVTRSLPIQMNESLGNPEQIVPFEVKTLICHLAELHNLNVYRLTNGKTLRAIRGEAGASVKLCE